MSIPGPLVYSPALGLVDLLLNTDYSKAWAAFGFSYGRPICPVGVRSTSVVTRDDDSSVFLDGLRASAPLPKQLAEPLRRITSDWGRFHARTISIRRPLSNISA